MADQLLLLDRDGVILQLLESGRRSARAVSEMTLEDHVELLLGWASQNGWQTAVVTNQPEIARGFVSESTVQAIHSELARLLPGLGPFFICPHDQADQCLCRKPRPGLVQKALHHFGVEPDDTVLVGDRWIDIAAAEAGGVASILVARPWSWLPSSTDSPPSGLKATAVVADLSQVPDLLLTRSANAS